MQNRDLVHVLSDDNMMAGFSRLNIAMVLTNPNTKDNPIVYVNDAFERTTGYSRSVVIGRNCRFLQGDETDKKDVDRIKAALANKTEVAVDILNYRASGQPFYNRLIIAPILGDDGALLYFLGIQKELRESERVGDNQIEAGSLALIRGRVHEDLSLILNSLGHMNGGDSISLVQEAKALPRRLECLQLIYEEMLLSDRQWNRVGLDLGSLLSRVANAVAHDEGGPGIRFVQIVESLEVNLEAAIRIALILSETLSNAFKHAFVGLDQGFVELRAVRMAAGGMRLMISDDGIGIPADIGWPGTNTMGGRLISALLEGLDATINVARGAAGTVVMIDVPVGFTDVT